ncbi:MAG: hypothetical protein AAFX04_06545 [Pseudomonadota bacterium]
MAEKLSRRDLRQKKAVRDQNETQLRDSARAAQQRFHPENLAMEAAGHAADKAKSAAQKAGETARKHKFKLIAGAALGVVALAWRPVKNLVAKRNPPS